MIPGEIFRSFAEFQGIVNINDFGFPLGFQELLQASLGFLWSFVFARIRLDPLSGLDPAPRLHIDDCFEIRNCRLRHLWSAVIKSTNFSARSTAPPLRLLHGALEILVPLQISQFRSFGEMSVNTVLTQILTVSWMWAPKKLHEKNWRESLRVLEFHHPPNFP